MNRFVLASFLIIAAFPTTATAQQATHNVQGAVRVVDVRARALEVTTGVGMALRVVRLAIPADLQVTASGAALPLARLLPGDLVRVSYGSRQGAYVAYTIERLERAP
jgi:hypothetical protein